MHHNVRGYQAQVLMPPFIIRTNKQLSSLKINEDDIISIITSLNSNKSHGWDKLFNKMIKMCDKNLVYPLKLIFKASIPEEVFPIVGKKLMLYQFTKKKVKIS